MQRWIFIPFVEKNTDMEKIKSQFTLLTEKRFLPFFATQFLGALNDNVFKNALIILIAFQGSKLVATNTNFLINLSAGLFILPFFLFSATAGQWIETQPKDKAIRLIKLIEVIIMSLAALAFFSGLLYMLIALLFLMGIQSTLFGPVKYSYIPQHLDEAELVEGNALVQMGTFVGILAGTMLGGFLIASDAGRESVGIAIVVIAVLGYLSSCGIPKTPASDANLKINLNVFSETIYNLRFLKQNRTVFLSILGISWFWFVGATYLVQLPNFTKTALGGSEQVVTLLLTLFTVGIGSGSLLCNWLSAGKIELGLVPLGSIGLSVFGLDMYFAPPDLVANTVVGMGEFLSWSHLRLMVDIVLIGFFGGIYIVPLFALIQQRSEPQHLSRVIAGNNILNALLMVLSAVFAIVLLGSGVSIAVLFLIVAILNAVVAIYIYTLVPEFFMRFMVWILIHSIYHVKTRGLEKIPDKGACILVCNHVSYVDAMIIAGCIQRPIRFVMYYKIYNLPVLNFISRTAKTIPIAGKFEDETLLKKAFDEIDVALSQGNLVCIFPEGKMTRNGNMIKFRDGIERILQRRRVAVIPMALQGLWGSVFSRYSASIFYRLLKGFKSRVGLVIGDVIAADDVSVEKLQAEVQRLYDRKI